MNTKEQALSKNIKYTITPNDMNFFYSDEARGIRLQVDYLKAEEKMKKEGVTHTIVVFGSARTKEDEKYYKEARKFGNMVGSSGETPQDSHVTIMTGGGPLHYSELLTTLIYKTGFKFYKFGEASALAVFNFGFILLVPIIFFIIV